MKIFITILKENIGLMAIYFLMSFFMIIIGLVIQFDTEAVITHLEIAYTYYYLSAINILLGALGVVFFTIKQYLD